MKKLYKRKNCFTLVEIMVAMGILAILMGFLFKFVIGAQEIWAASRNVAGLYDKAQIAMRWLEEDLKASMYQSETEYPGREIPFQIDRDASNQLQSISMVLARKNVVETGSPSVTYYALPVKYELDGGKLYRTELHKAEITGPLAFNRSGTLDDDNIILEGIENFSIYTSNSILDAKPALVKIEMTLCDPEILKDAQKVSNTQAEKHLKDRHTRVFSKIIFLNK